MAQERFKVDIDLDQYSLNNAVIQVLSGDPAGPNVLGQIYFHSGNFRLRQCTVAGSPGTWVEYGTGAGSATLTAGTGLSGTTYDPSTGSTFALDFSELTDMTAAVSGTTEIILQDAGTESRKAINEIDLSFFDNTLSGFTSNTGTVSSLADLSITATATELNLLDLSGLTTGWALLADSATTASWQAIPAGATTFIGLTDTDEPDYTGHGGDLVRVNATPDGLEFVDGTTLFLGTGITTLSGYGISDTMANFDSAVSDGTIVWAGDTSTSGWGFVIDDDTMATASATTLASSESIKAYVDDKASGGLTLQGDYNASTNSPDLDTAPSGLFKGDTYVVSVAGDFFGEAVQAGDQLTAKQDDPTTLAHWIVVNKNIPDIVNASETAAGLVEEGTDAEVLAGTATGGSGAELYVSPDKLKTHLRNTNTAHPPADGDLAVALVYSRLLSETTTTIAVTHNIGRQHVNTEIYEVADGMTRVRCEVENTSTTVTTLKFNTAPTTNQFRVVITG